VRKKRGPNFTVGINEPNMTPLIDVSLVLVVILMVATPMALQSAIVVGRASASGRAVEKQKIERIELTVIGADSVLVNRQLVSREQLGATLKPLLAASATRDVVVRCDDAVPHGAFVSVLDEARLQGAARIAVTGR
jgi:biopolymer transport protein ExbD